MKSSGTIGASAPIHEGAPLRQTIQNWVVGWGGGGVPLEPGRYEQQSTTDWEALLRKQNANNDDICSDNGRLRAELERLRIEVEEADAREQQEAKEPNDLEEEVSSLVFAAVQQVLVSWPEDSFTWHTVSKAEKGAVADRASKTIDTDVGLTKDERVESAADRSNVSAPASMPSDTRTNAIMANTDDGVSADAKAVAFADKTVKNTVASQDESVKVVDIPSTTGNAATAIIGECGLGSSATEELMDKAIDTGSYDAETQQTKASEASSVAESSKQTFHVLPASTQEVGVGAGHDVSLEEKASSGFAPKAEVLQAIDAAVRAAVKEEAESPAPQAMSPAEITVKLVEEKMALRELVELQKERIRLLEKELGESAPQGQKPGAVAQKLSNVGGTLSAGVTAMRSGGLSAVLQLPPPQERKAKMSVTVGAEYEIVGRSGLMVRREASLGSEKLFDLSVGSRVRIVGVSDLYPRRVEIVAIVRSQGNGSTGFGRSRRRSVEASATTATAAVEASPHAAPRLHETAAVPLTPVSSNTCSGGADSEARGIDSASSNSAPLVGSLPTLGDTSSANFAAGELVVSATTAESVEDPATASTGPSPLSNATPHVEVSLEEVTPPETVKSGDESADASSAAREESLVTVVGWISAFSKDWREFIRLAPPENGTENVPVPATPSVESPASPFVGGGDAEGREEGVVEVKSVTLSCKEWECLHQYNESSLKRVEELAKELGGFDCSLLQSFEMRSVLGELQLGTARAEERLQMMRETASMANEDLEVRRAQRVTQRQRQQEVFEMAGELEAVPSGQEGTKPLAAVFSQSSSANQGGASASASLRDSTSHTDAGGCHQTSSSGDACQGVDAVDWDRLMSERETTAAALQAALQRVACLQRESEEIQRERAAAEGRGRGELGGLRKALRRLARPTIEAVSRAIGVGSPSVNNESPAEALFVHRVNDLKRTVEELRSEVHRTKQTESALRRSVEARRDALREVLYKGVMAALKIPQCGPFQLPASIEAERQAMRAAVEEQLLWNLQLSSGIIKDKSTAPNSRRQLPPTKSMSSSTPRRPLRLGPPAVARCDNSGHQQEKSQVRPR
eukprot:TRINITY_DN29320_c0_g1_i1.p1 TRINITY_DN29320_c0_g1~~TRINITY_DN29320_c0_g1_i1.p1  ORF type:complete len:1089 (-),score=221.15 TRINITY_DN29320_c0_g1_i1:183-3449(-)